MCSYDCEALKCVYGEEKLRNYLLIVNGIFSIEFPAAIVFISFYTSNKGFSCHKFHRNRSTAAAAAVFLNPHTFVWRSIEIEGENIRKRHVDKS